MTFSQFVQALYPYCNEGTSKPEYIRHLIDKIMDGQPGRAHADGGYQNPLRAMDDRTLLNYFYGRRSISECASTIYSSINIEKFEKYIDRRCSLDAQVKLSNDLSAIEKIDAKGTVPEICAQLFEKILRELANR